MFIAIGRHTGIGKREGTLNARMSIKVLWMRRIRILRRLLRKYRASKKIDKHTYHSFYMRSKGNQFKNKYVLIEAIHKAKTEQKRGQDLTAQAEAKKGKKKVEAKETAKETQKDAKKDAQKEKAAPKEKGKGKEKKKEKAKKETEGKK